jgi:hypothetical protein
VNIEPFPSRRCLARYLSDDARRVGSATNETLVDEAPDQTTLVTRGLQMLLCCVALALSFCTLTYVAGRAVARVVDVHLGEGAHEPKHDMF